jgi:hypothetical protein
MSTHGGQRITTVIKRRATAAATQTKCSCPHTTTVLAPTQTHTHTPGNFWQLKPPPLHCSYAAMWLLLMVAEPHVLSLAPVRKSGWCRLQ